MSTGSGNSNSDYIDPQIAPILEKMVEQMKNMPSPGSRSPEEVRDGFEKVQIFWNENGPALPAVKDKTVAGPFGPVPVRHYHPADVVQLQPVLIFFHGGGWICGSPDTHDYLCRFLAMESGADLVSVDYGLAPERHYPDTVSECLGVVRWLEKNSASWGLDPDRIAVGGDSAGANLALAVALSLRDDRESWLKFCLLFYASLNPECRSESHRLFGKIDYGFSIERYNWFWKSYVPDLSMRKDPLAVPLHADLSGLPPMFLAAAGLDPLRDDTLGLSRKLEAAGVSHECRVYPGVIHGFLQFLRTVEIAGKAASDAVIALKNSFAG